MGSIKGMGKMSFLVLGILLISAGSPSQPDFDTEEISLTCQTSSKELDWSSFFANLPKDLLSRVKQREGISSVRILTNEETGGSTAVKVFSAKIEEPAHTHFETKQMFIVLDGELTFWKLSKEAGLIEQTLKRGQYILINPGESHGFRGTALVGGVDIGKGTALDTYHESENPDITPKLSLTPMLPMNQGVVTIQMPGYEQRELLKGYNPNIEIIAETITSKNSSTAASDQMVVIVSGEVEVNQNGDVKKLQPGDFIFAFAGESHSMTPASEIPVVTIVFSLFE